MSESKKTTEKKDMKKMLEESAVELVRNLVPEGRDIDKYLTSIAERWNQLIDPAARKNLIIDVQALVKAHMNQILKIQKPSSFDDTMLDENSERIIKMNSALGKIHNKAALQLYIKVYITKLLLNINK